MKKFWTDYYEMCLKPQYGWIKIHKKGYAFLWLITTVICFTWALLSDYSIRESIKNKIKSKFKKN